MAGTIDISEARNRWHKLDEKLGEERVLYVTRHRRPAFVVVDPAYMEALVETLDVLSEPDSLDMLERSIRDVRAGRVRSHEELEAEFG